MVSCISFAGRLAAFALSLAAFSATGSAQVLPPNAEADATRQFMEEGRVPDSKGTGPHSVVKHVLPTLPDHVVYQPEDLAALGGNKLPLYIFGNGACTEDGASARHHLIEIASHGYLAIAPGGIYSGPNVDMAPEDWAEHRAKTNYRQLGEAIDWARAENSRPESPFFGRIDIGKVALSGYSCGGVQALKYAGDPRVTTLVIMNSGILAKDIPQTGEMEADKGLLDLIDVPTLYVLGGPSDIAYPNGMDDFARIEGAPVAVINIDATHEGTYAQPNGGKAAQAATAWLDWQLKGETEAAKWFAGDDCVLCADPDWTVERRNWDEDSMTGQMADRAVEAANKKLVLDMWHEVINGRNIDAARKYMAPDYKQNSASAPDGVEALIAFLHTEFPDSQPLEPGTYPLTDFEFVIAEGDLVQLMFQRQLPDPADPAKTVPVWWYDTYRVKDGKIVEHWDSVIE